MEQKKITKTYDAQLDVNEGKREVLAIISTNAVDRDGEVVNPKGLKKKNYAGNPVVMVNHDYQTLPIGKALWVKADDDKVLAKYKVSDATQLARDVFGLLQDGTLNAHSIGFVANYSSKPTSQEKNARPELKDAKLIHRDWELMEFSVVGIPANPEALTLAVSKGYSQETLKFIGMMEGIQTQIVEKAITEVAKPNPKQLSEAIYEAAKKLHITINVDKAVAAAIKRLAI